MPDHTATPTPTPAQMPPETPANVTLVQHPLVRHKLSLMRDATCPTNSFRHLLREITLFLGYEAMRDLPLEDRPVATPMETAQMPVLTGKKLCFVSILRAGDGLMGAMLELVPSARVGHVGLVRDDTTLQPTEYLFKVPKDLEQRRVYVLDPMLATGNSAALAITRLKEAGAKDLRFVCLLAAPQGVETLGRAHPDVEIVTAALDRDLDERGYILPGLGDAGDRLYGTK
ncbi:uracil phosphoribosyltransferase [Rhodothalassium salexigens]|nr:uracil phosphoribosyltransferase [Rhodothalassium salexigens]